MSAFGLNTCTEMSEPLINDIVNNALFQSVPNVNQTLPQIVYVLHFRLVDLLLHQAPDFVINWIQVGAVRRPQIWWDESRSLAFKKTDRRTSPVRWSTVLLKYEKLAGDVTYVR